MRDSSKKDTFIMSKGCFSTREIETIVRIKMESGCDDLFPKKAHESDAAFDICSAEDTFLYLNEVKAIFAGFYMALSEGWEAQIRPRSGLSAKYGITIVNSPGTIDSGYRGPVKVLLKYSEIKPYKDIFDCPEKQLPHMFTIKRGDRIAQMLIKKVPCVKLEKVDVLEDSDRGTNGFGSTGIKKLGENKNG